MLLYICVGNTESEEGAIEIVGQATEILQEVNTAVNNVIPNNRTVWDGQWVYKELQVCTALGTFSLADYLPNDGYAYDVKFSIRGYSDSEQYYIECATDLLPTARCRVMWGAGYSRQNACAFDMPIGNGRYVELTGAIGSNLALWAIGYRRLGTNV